MLKAVAIDPGITTGYAIGHIEDGEMVVVSGQEKWSHLEFWEFLEENKPDYTICERFEFRKRARPGLVLYSRELIGVANLYSQTRDQELIMQMPAVIGGFFSDDRLKKDGLYKPGKDHSNDATRHLLHWFKFGEGFQFNKKGYRSAV